MGIGDWGFAPIPNRQTLIPKLKIFILFSYYKILYILFIINNKYLRLMKESSIKFRSK